MIIGLNGIKHSGKDTAGTYLAEKYGFKTASFAAPLKSSAAAALGLDPDPTTFEEWKNNRGARVVLHVNGAVVVDISVREYLQFYGTQAHRQIPEFGDAVWVDMMHSKTLDGDVAITDCRFPNEADWVHAAGGIVAQIERAAVAVEIDGHASETPLPAHLVDVVVPNNGFFEELYRRLDALVFLSREAERNDGSLMTVGA